MPHASELFDLSGKVALVTGGSRGLGREMVLAFAEHGADVVIASRKEDACVALAEEVRERFGRRALGVGCHVGRWEEVGALAERCWEEFEKVDVLVNNAGMSPLYPSLGEISEALYDKVMDVNLKGAFRLSTLVGERMVAGAGGSIVSVSSVAAIAPTPVEAVYGLAKAGLHNMTASLAKAFAPKVRVNVIMPGPFLTDISKAWGPPEAMEKVFARSLLLERAGKPEEVVGAALFLASDASSYSTGGVIDLSGGLRGGARVSDALEGIERGPTEAWLLAHVDGLGAPFEWSRLTGGTSNLTYAVRDAKGRRFVVRRPPTGKLLPKAHDMGREFRILSALAPTEVPVAAPLAHCEDPSVTGAPFYAMDYCVGHTIRTIGFEYHPLAPAARIAVGHSIIDALVALHALVPEEIGLGRLGRPDAYVARQLERWADSWRRSNDAAGFDFAIDAAQQALSARIPAQGPGRVVHGDFGPHNMLIGDDGRLVAITDWEIGTLGDPLADLGYFANNWADGPAGSDVPYGEGRLDEGYATRDALLERYARASGRSLEQLPFYVAFNYFKTLCIIQGVYARFARGVRGSQGIELDAFRERILRAQRTAERAIEEL